MKRFANWSRKLLLSCLLCLIVTAQSLAVELVAGEYPPFITAERSDNGFVTAIVLAAFHAVDMPTELDFQPWARVEHEVDENKKTSYAYLETPERLAKWHYSKPFYEGRNVFFSLKSSDFQITSLEDLKSLHVGIVGGYSYGKQFDALRYKLNLEMVPDDKMNLEKLLLERIDITVTDEAVGQYLLKKHYSAQDQRRVKVIPVEALGTWNMHVICSRRFENCQSNLEKFNQGLQIINENGVKEAIIKRFLD